MKKLFSFFQKKNPNPAPAAAKHSTQVPSSQMEASKSSQVRTPVPAQEKRQAPAYREIYADDGDLGYC